MTRRQALIIGLLFDGVLLVFCLLGMLIGFDLLSGGRGAPQAATPTPELVPIVFTATATAPTSPVLPTPPPAGDGPPVISCSEVRQVTWWFGEVLSCTVRGDHLSVAANYAPIVVDRYGESSEGLSLQRKLDSLAVREATLRAVYTYFGAFPEIGSLDLTVYYWRAPALALPHVDRESADRAARANGGLGTAELADRYGPKDEEVFARLVHRPEDPCYERGGEATLQALGATWGEAIAVGPQACVNPQEQAILSSYQ